MDERSSRLPERVRWAGQLIAARAAMDEPRFLGLLDVMPYDPQEVGEYVGAVLQTVVRTVNSWPRGFARMGRDTSA